MRLLFALLLTGIVLTLCGVSTPGTAYHLTARPWQPLAIPPSQYLDAIEGLCRFSIQHQNAEGAIIDPVLKVEWQYGTPYFAYAVGTLIEAGRASDLLANGVRAMEHSTSNFAGGRLTIPDEHGEFFIAALTGALDLYKNHIPAAQWSVWQQRLKNPTAKVIKGTQNNWETYVMKGDWMRARAGLISRADAIAVIEDAWHKRQSQRIAAAPWFLYHDRTSDPDTLSVEAVGRGNLLALTHFGYDGPSAADIRRIAETATRNTLYLQDPSGQVPANGRTDDHVWVEIGYQLAFEVMAERAAAADDRESAGQFRHAAMLAFQSAQRWRRTDPPWTGSYYVTKSFAGPESRIGLQPASQYSNYNGSLMFHLAEAYHMRRTEIPEQPAPNEIGGYAFALDDEFSSAFANAGGMFLQANLRAQETKTHENYWTPLGIIRFGRPGWETRLGPSDGALTAETGVSFAPEFQENGQWLRVAGLAKRYRATWSVTFSHPLLVRCSLTYSPKEGQQGPVFRDDLTITPDAVLSEMHQSQGTKVPWGVTWPLLENDGRPLQVRYSGPIASVSYPNRPDQQNFIALDDGAQLVKDLPLLRSTYGDLRPVRMSTTADVRRTLIYPRAAADPSAEEARRSFVITKGGFQSVLGKLNGTIYYGRTAAGGVGRTLDLNNDGTPEVSFPRSCGFLAQLRDGTIVKLEADQDIKATVYGREIALRTHVPVEVGR